MAQQRNGVIEHAGRRFVAPLDASAVVAARTPTISPADLDDGSDTLTLSTRAELRLLRGTVVADRIQGQQILVNNTTEVFTVDGKPNAASGNQRVKATITPRPKSTDATTTQPGAVLKSSPRIGTDKP